MILRLFCPSFAEISSTGLHDHAFKAGARCLVGSGWFATPLFCLTLTRACPTVVLALSKVSSCPPEAHHIAFEGEND